MQDLQGVSPLLREIVDTCRLQDVPAGGSLGGTGTTGPVAVNGGTLWRPHVARELVSPEGTVFKRFIDAKRAAGPKQ